MKPSTRGFAVFFGLAILSVGTARQSFAAYGIDMSGPPAVAPGHGLDPVQPAQQTQGPACRTNATTTTTNGHHSSRGLGTQTSLGVTNVVFVPVYEPVNATPAPDLSQHSLSTVEDGISAEASALQDEFSSGLITSAQHDRESDLLDSIKADARQQEFSNGGYLTGDQESALLNRIQDVRQWIAQNQAS